MIQRIAIIGVGAFGGALAYILRKKHEYNLSLWDKDEKKVPGQLTLRQTVEHAHIIFLCVPSWAVRESGESIAEYISHDALVVSSTKGIEEETLQTSEQVLAETLAQSTPVLFLNGPMLAAEIRQDLPAFAVAAGDTDEGFQAMQEIFSDTKLYLEYSNDLHGTALAGVLKNIYSIGLGMTEAMKLGSNFRGWFVRQAAKEMADIIELLGGKRETAYNAAGLGDLIATGFSPHSRNCRVGQELIASGECVTVSEGAESFPQMLELIGGHISKFPILAMLGSIVVEKRNAHEAFASLLAGEQMHGASNKEAV